MSCEHADQDAAYVLGALSPAERLEFERHLSTCAECALSVREMAGLPGLLSRIDPAVLEEPSDEVDPPPPALLLNLVREVRRERRRRLVVSAGLAAAAILAVVGLGVAGLSGAFDHHQSSPPVAVARGQAMTTIGNVPVRATLALQPVAWGTRLSLACTYDPDSQASWGGGPAPTYTLVVRTRDGHTETVGTWRSVDGKTMQVAAATAAKRQDIADVEVLTASGRPVLRLAG